MSFTRYLRYRLKQSTLRSAVLSLICLSFVLYGLSEENRYGMADHTQLNSCGLQFLAIVLGIFSVLIPILETSCLKNRRNLDTLYCLPLTRKKLALVHYLSGMIQLVFLYSLPFFSAYAWLACNTGYFDLQWMLPYYFVSLLSGLIVYSVILFVFSQANTTSDGVLMCILWIFAGSLVISSLLSLLREFDYSLSYHSTYSSLPFWGNAFAPLSKLTQLFRGLIECNKTNYFRFLESLHRYSEELPFYFIWLGLGIVCSFGAFFTVLRKGAERAGEPSTSWFGFKLLIPLYGFSWLIQARSSMGFLPILILSFMVIGYIILRRGFKFRLSDCMMLGSAVLLSVLFELRI